MSQKSFRRKRTDWRPYRHHWGLPHAYVSEKNPFFTYEARMLDQIPDAETLRTDTGLYLYVAAVLAVGLCVPFAGLSLLLSSETNMLSLVATLLAAVLFVIFIDRLLFDFSVISAVLSITRDDLQTERYDLIRVTPVSTNNVLRAKFAIVQLHQWRRWRFRLALTVGAVTIVFFNILFSSIFMPTFSPLYDVLPIDSSVGVFNAFFYATSFLVIGVILILEVRWRLNVLTAVGLALAALRLEDTITLLLSGIVTIVLWIVSMALFFLPQAVPGLLAVPVAGGGGTLQLIAALLVLWVLYLSYRRLTTIALNTAARQLETEPG